MYLLGAVYLRGFYRFFGIDGTLMEMSLEKTVGTTWTLELLFLPVVVSVWGFLRGRELLLPWAGAPRSDANDLEVALTASFWVMVALGLVGYIAFVLSGRGQDTELTLYYVFLLASLLSSLATLLWHTKIAGFARLVWAHLFGIPSLLIFLTLLVLVYAALGYTEAKRVSHGMGATKIHLETRTGWQSPPNAVLVAHMSEKYFICEPVTGPLPPPVIVIEDEQLTMVTLQK